jgi:hypothetical protein
VWPCASCTPNSTSASAAKAGGTAAQNTSGMLSAVSHIKPIASAGPMNAPIVSSDWRKPNAAPRSPVGARSAISASRGAPRMPLPMRSTKRAVITHPTVPASGKTGLAKAARP